MRFPTSAKDSRIPRYCAFLRCPVASNVLADNGDKREKEEKAAKDQSQCDASTIDGPMACANPWPEAGEQSDGKRSYGEHYWV